MTSPLVTRLGHARMVERCTTIIRNAEEGTRMSDDARRILLKNTTDLTDASIERVVAQMGEVK